MDALEGLIGRRVSVATVVPFFNDTHVVSKGNESWVEKLNSDNGINKELETDGFGPTDVLFAPKSLLPVWVETPCLPPTTNDDANAKQGAGIQKGKNVGIIWGGADGLSCEVGW